jgi:hypothetical protein
MKQWITKEQVMELSDAAQQRLAAWLVDSITYDDDLVRVYIAEEDGILTLGGGNKDIDSSGVFCGHWNEEFNFNAPFDIDEYMDPGYRCKISSHRGTVLPLLDIGQMMEIIHDSQFSLSIALKTSQVTLTLEIADDVCDQFWHITKMLLEHEEFNQ